MGGTAVAEPRQIAVVSGKGGTGKTIVSSSLACLAASAGEKLVLVDADIDTPDLHIIFGGENVSREEVGGPLLARLNAVKPERGGSWEDICFFGAISGVEVDPLRCVGCRVCELLAAPGAVSMQERVAGEIVRESPPWGSFLHARLLPGEPGFGGFVYRLRAAAEDIARENGFGLILIDAPAGLGCPVIASISGCDRVLIVAEPTLSGRHDFERICELSEKLGVRATACVNKHDINPGITAEIESLCRRRSIPLAGRIPWDESVLRALEAGESPVTGCPQSAASRAMEEIAKNLRIIGGEA